MANSPNHITNPNPPHAPSQATLRHYTEILVNLPGNPRLPMLDWISSLLGRHDGQPETQESLIRELYEFLDWYCRSRNLDRGVLISSDVQEMLIEEGRRDFLGAPVILSPLPDSDLDGSGGRGCFVGENQREDSDEKIGSSGFVDLDLGLDLAVVKDAELRAADDSSGTITPLRPSSITFPPNSRAVDPPALQRPADLQMSNDVRPLNSDHTTRAPTLTRARTRTLTHTHTHTRPLKPSTICSEAMKARSRDYSAKFKSRRLTRQLPGFNYLTKEQQDRLVEENWRTILEDRHRKGTSYQAILARIEAETAVAVDYSDG